MPFPLPFRPSVPDAGCSGTPGPDDPPGRRERHDAFNEGRKATFLTALIKTGCLKHAARAAGVSAKTVYNHQDSNPDFAEGVRTALAMSATPIEMIAWRRAVHGVEQEFACGGQVHVRRRYSDHLLRLLLQGSNPKKFGPNPGLRRKRVLRHERKEIERNVRAEIEAEYRGREPDMQDVQDEILRKIDAVQRHETRKKLAGGWTRARGGYLLPPGYGPLPGFDPGSGGGVGWDEYGEETPRDSV